MTDDMAGSANADVSCDGDFEDDASQDMSAETSEDMSDEAPTDMGEDVPVYIPHDVTEGTDVTEDGADGLTEDTAPDIAGSETDDIGEIEEDVPADETENVSDSHETYDLQEDTPDEMRADLEENAQTNDMPNDLSEDAFDPLVRLNESNQSALEYHEKWDRGDLKFEPSEDGKSSEFISPFSIAQPEGLNEGNFWDHHGNDRDTYARAAADVPKVVRALNGGASLDDLRADGQYRETLDSFWSTGDPISVVKYGDSYICDAGRHRVAIAQEQGLDTIPVSVKGTFHDK